MILTWCLFPPDVNPSVTSALLLEAGLSADCYNNGGVPKPLSSSHCGGGAPAHFITTAAMSQRREQNYTGN